MKPADLQALAQLADHLDNEYYTFKDGVFDWGAKDPMAAHIRDAIDEINQSRGRDGAPGQR